MVYDAVLWNKTKKMNLFSLFIGRILFQLYYTICEWWTANAGILYEKRKSISIPVSAVILMIITITYKLVLVVVGIGVAVFGRGFLDQYLEGILPVFYLGLGLNIFCVTFMTILVFHPLLARSFLVWGLSILEKFRILRHKKEG